MRVHALLALSSRQAQWVGRDSSAITADLADELLRELALDVVTVRLTAPAVEVTRGGVQHSPECRIPIGRDGELGMLVAAARRTSFPDEDERLVLEVAANQLAAGLLFARDASQRRQAARRLTTQDAVTRALAESRTLHEAAPRILGAVCEHLGWDFGGLWQVDHQGEVLRCAEVWHRPSVCVPAFEEMSRRLTFRRGIGLPGRVWLGRRADWIPDVATDDNFPRADVAQEGGLHGALGFPILLGDEVLGVIEFFSHEIRQPDEDLLEMLTAIGSQIGQFLERKRAEEASTANEQRFAGFAHHLPGLAWIKDLEGRYLYANDAALLAFCTTRETLYGRRDDEIFPPQTAAQFRENDRLALAHTTGLQTIETLEHPDGIVHHSIVAKFPIMSATGEPAFVGGIAIDVTDRLRAEEALRRSQERLELAQRGARVGTFEWVIPTGEVTWTEAEAALYGLTPGAFGGRYESWLNAVHPDDRDRAEADAARAVDERTDLDTEFRVVWPNGTVRWIAAKGTVFYDDAGRPVRMLGINMDVTERKDAEEALREADRRKDEFLAMLAHELRNPLAPIRAGLHLLGRVDHEGAQAAHVREMLDRQVQYLVRLVDDLLELARITRGDIELRRERVELGTAIAGAIETSRPLIDERSHRLAVTLPSSDSLVLDADPVRLSQVVANLLNNAARYTDPGGRITLSAERHGEEVAIRVADDGIGIPPEMLSRVFEPFTRVDRSSARSHGGLGIGLALVKSLVEMHGGSVSARSDGMGAGSEFTVRLPLAQATTPARSAGDAVPARTSDAGRRILVVDDNRDAAESLGLLLEMMGHQVCVTHGGAEGLALMRTFEPAVVLLDIGMPDVDGYEVARRIREEGGSRRPLLIAITGWGQVEDRRRARQAGFDHHLTKPVDVHELQRLLVGTA
jgi:PAS domain S-box-containing protein